MRCLAFLIIFTTCSLDPFAWHLGTEGYTDALQITAWSVNYNDFPSLVTPVQYTAVSEFPFTTSYPFFLLQLNRAYLFSSQGQGKQGHHQYPVASAQQWEEQFSRGTATEMSCFSITYAREFQSPPALLFLQKSYTPRLFCGVHIPQKDNYGQELERQTAKWDVPAFFLLGNLFGLRHFCLWAAGEKEKAASLGALLQNLCPWPTDEKI